MKKKKKRKGNYLLEKLKGERWPELSLAAHPKAFTGCSSSWDVTALLSDPDDTQRIEPQVSISQSYTPLFAIEIK